jgi:hypothetical protein
MAKEKLLQTELKGYQSPLKLPRKNGEVKDIVKSI